MLSDNDNTQLGHAALGEIISRAEPILGANQAYSSTTGMCNWMATVPDDTKIVHMNLPGTHDTSTWNYSEATQASLNHYTGPLPDAKYYRCQQHSMLQMLDDGIRVFDLRYAYNPGNDTIGFYHSVALLSPTTRMEDVFFGLYCWLDNHPSEAILVSLNQEGSSGTPNDAKLQEMVYIILNSKLAQRYWVQSNGVLGTLGEARGKLTLLQRFNYNLLSPSLTKRIGIHLSPEKWTDNGTNIELVYNDDQNQVAYIEDNYLLKLPTETTTEEYIQRKFAVTVAHLEKASTITQNVDQLYISFASGAADINAGHSLMTPRIYALGDGKNVQGVNQLLLSWLRERRGKRVGIVLLDFYDAVPGLVEAVIGI